MNAEISRLFTVALAPTLVINHMQSNLETNRTQHRLNSFIDVQSLVNVDSSFVTASEHRVAAIQSTMVRKKTF